MDKSLIQIFRGDDTDGLGYQSIQGKITTTLDLTGCRAVFRYLGFTQEFDPIPENGRITITMPASATSKFPPGLGYASLRVYDSEGKVRTFTNRIPVFVTVYAPSECGGEFEVVFNGGNLELEPLKIKSVNGYRIYDGYLEQIIDKATAIEYGLALLFDSGDSGKDANSGYAATPKAVQAAYDAIIGELTDNYYNAEETEEAIDRIAAYYITSDAQGNPFATYAALAGATAFYSGGQLRTPTRNDYCVVLADETHGGEQYRYIYSVNQQGAGQWEAQYAVGGSVELDNTVTLTSGNGVKSSGIWSAIWGALTALPGFSSLYDWVVAQLAGKASTADATLTPIYDDTYAITGYQLGSQTDKPLQPKGDYALLSDIYAAVRQIAPDFTAKAYVRNELCTYNGVVYRCNSAYTATASSTKPDADTTHWEAKPVSDLFLRAAHLVTEVASESRQFADVPGVVVFNPNGVSYLSRLSEPQLMTLLQNGGVVDAFGNAMCFPTRSATSNEIYNFALTAGSGHTGNLAALDASGNPTDSGKKAADFAPLASPAFTGTPTAPTPNAQSADTQIATKKYVDDAVAGGGGGNLDYVMRVDPETGGIYYTTPDTNA